MRKLLLIPLKLILFEGKCICKFCGISLRHYNPIDGFDTYWCPRCESWRWIGYEIPGVPKRKTPQIEYLAPDEKQSLLWMQKIMGKYEEEMIEKLDGEVRIYSSEVYSQEFLYGLIPSKKGKLYELLKVRKLR